MGWIHRARWAEGLAGLLDDEIDAGRALRVLVHLENCPDCLREIEELARLQRSLTRLAGVR